MKRGSLILSLLAVLSLPLLLAANVSRALSYDRLEADVARLEGEAGDWLENNRRMAVALESLRAPSRIRQIAEESLGRRRATVGDVLRVELPGE